MEDLKDPKPEVETEPKDTNPENSGSGLTSKDSNETTNQISNGDVATPTQVDTGSSNPQDTTANDMSLQTTSSAPGSKIEASPSQPSGKGELPSQQTAKSIGPSEKIAFSDSDTSNDTHKSNETSATSGPYPKDSTPSTHVNGKNELPYQKSDTSTGPSTDKTVVTDKNITNHASLTNETPVPQTQNNPIQNKSDQNESKVDSSSLSVSVQNEDVEKKRDTSNSEPTLKIDPGQSATNGISSNHQVNENGQTSVVGLSLANDVPIASRLNQPFPQQARVSVVAHAHIKNNTNESMDVSETKPVDTTDNQNNDIDLKVSWGVSKATNEPKTGLTEKVIVEQSIHSHAFVKPKESDNAAPNENQESKVLIKNDDSTDNDTNESLNKANHTQTDEKDTKPKHTEPPKNQNNAAEELRKLLLGQCSFKDLLPLPKKNVRIFVSSTFTDTKEERNALMQYVYPKLEEYCRDRHGLEFQVVDMRWGVPEQASNNHTTSDLCIQEIHKCQEVSVGPNFVAIVGDKYGYRPIPSVVPLESFQILQQMAKQGTDSTDWSVVEHWYRLDENAVPAVYVLQPISSLLPHYNNTKQPDLRKEAQNSWNIAQQQMSSALRKAAESAHAQGKMSSEQKQLFFMSVTENEITNGLNPTKSTTATKTPQNTCFCIIRKIQDIQNHIRDPNAYRFVDINNDAIDNEAQGLLSQLRDKTLTNQLPQTNMTQVEIDWSTSGAKISLEKYRDIDVAKYVQETMQQSGDTNGAQVQEHHIVKYREYLNSICEAFFVNIQRLVNQGSAEQKNMYDDVTSDILQHWHLAKIRCEVFEGRKDILDEVKRFLSAPSNAPLVVHGNSGCGKTSVMAKIMELISTQTIRSISGVPFVLVARFLGTTPNTSNLHTLLVSLCAQFGKMLQIDWAEPENISELIQEFHSFLAKFEEQKIPLVLLLDSVDQLMPAYNAYKLDWLPKQASSNVYIILSAIDEGYEILDTFKSKYKNTGGKCIEVKPLGESLGFEVISKWLAKDNRKITTQQHGIVKLALEKCSLPLYARIVYDSIRRWKSYDIPTVDKLMTTVRGAINHLFQTMESKFGAAIVKHSLAYLTASRYGLSEMEMEHVLSLDDTLLNSIFKFWNPPIRRIAPLLWTRVRTEIHSYIVERSADDTLVLFWYHRQFIEATREKYLKDPEFANHIHKTLTEYFLGTWGGGKEKPFSYTPEQVTRFKLAGPKSKADRKVPLQSYVYTSKNSVSESDVKEGSDIKDGSDASDVIGGSDVRINKRKLTELPYQLLKAKNYDGLKSLVFFSLDWLQYKLKSTSAQQVLEEIELFTQDDKTMRKDKDMKLLYVNMQLVRYYVNKYPDSLAYELAGRLAKYVGKSPFMTELIKQCDANGGILLPLTTCFESANLGMMQNINFRSSEPWQQGGCFTCTPDFKTLYMIDYNDEGFPILIQFDLATGEKINSVVLQKVKEKKYEYTTDEYFQLELMKDGSKLLAFYKQKFIAGYTHTYRNDGLFDVIDPNTGTITKTFEGPLHREEFFNPLQYCTDNWVCVRFGIKIPVININTDVRKDLNRPHMLDRDEKLFIMCGQKKTDMREFATKAAVGEFDISDSQVAMAASKDFSFVAMMSATDRQLKIFYLSNKVLKANKRYGNVFKWKKCFNLEDKVQETVNDLFQPVSVVNEKGETEYKTNNNITMTLAPNDYYLMINFRGTREYITYLWNFRLYNARRQFIGAVTPRMHLVGKYPMFNHDGSCVVYARDKTITVVSTTDCTILNEYNMADTVKDFYTSQVSNQMLVMLKMNLVLLDITVTSEIKVAVKTRGKMESDDKVNVLLPAEEGGNGMMCEVAMVTENEAVTLEEIQEPANVSNPDRISTARSRQNLALDKRITPNGLRVIHYHSKAQVIDISKEEIQYTPKKGDQLMRTVVGEAGVATNESVGIPGLDAAAKVNRAVVDLMPGDRIVNEQGKVKMRVNSDQAGKFKLMVVPSVFTVYSVEELKLVALKRITVYQESFLTVSNNYIVTARTKSNTHFANIYKQDKGTLVATHELAQDVACARFSMDETQLFIVDKALCVRVYLAPNYNSIEQKVQCPASEVPTAFAIQNIHSFPLNRNVIILSFGLLGKTSLDSIHRYIHLDLVSKSIGKTIETSPGLEDISKDGSIGVDLQLNIYDMRKGQILYQVDHESAQESDQRERTEGYTLKWKVRYKDKYKMKHLQARLSNDAKHLIYSDKRDDTLHVYRLHSTHVTHLHTCFSHAPSMRIVDGLQVRVGGHVVSIRGEDICIPLLLRPDSKTANMKQDINYTDEQSRALSLVSAYAGAEDNGIKALNLDKTKSMFHRRGVLLEQEPEPVATQESSAKSTVPNADSKPKVLLLASNLLLNFDQNRCTPKLNMEKIHVTSTNDAIRKLDSLDSTYDCIVLQQVSDDIKQLNMKQYQDVASVYITKAKSKCKKVVFSFAPPHMDRSDLNQRLSDINDSLTKQITAMQNVDVCTNGSLCESGKIVQRFFKTQNTLSVPGIKKISQEIKMAIFKVLDL